MFTICIQTKDLAVFQKAGRAFHSDLPKQLMQYNFEIRRTLYMKGRTTSSNSDTTSLNTSSCLPNGSHIATVYFAKKMSFMLKNIGVIRLILRQSEPLAHIFKEV